MLMRTVKLLAAQVRTPEGEWWAFSITYVMLLWRVVEVCVLTTFLLLCMLPSAMRFVCEAHLQPEAI